MFPIYLPGVHLVWMLHVRGLFVGHLQTFSPAGLLVLDRLLPNTGWVASSRPPIELAVMLGGVCSVQREGINQHRPHLAQITILLLTPKWSHGSHKR